MNGGCAYRSRRPSDIERPSGHPAKTLVAVSALFALYRPVWSPDPFPLAPFFSSAMTYTVDTAYPARRASPAFLPAFSLAALAFALALPATAVLASDNAPDHTAKMVLGKQLFMGGAVPACALCHTLKDAGAEGAIGPVLDELQPEAARVAKALRTGLGAMPSYAGKLSDAQMDALATYVAHASRGEK